MDKKSTLTYGSDVDFFHQLYEYCVDFVNEQESEGTQDGEEEQEERGKGGKRRKILTINELSKSSLSTILMKENASFSFVDDESQAPVESQTTITSSSSLSSTVSSYRVLGLNLLNQNSSKFDSMINKYSSPRQICGAVSLAYVDILYKYFVELEDNDRTSNLSNSMFQNLYSRLTNFEVLSDTIESKLQALYSMRMNWIKSHPSQFPTEKLKGHYLRNWMANYEISDFLRQQYDGKSLAHQLVCFVRFNQYPLLIEATHEEKERLLEEKRFGGSLTTNGAVAFEAGESPHLLEYFFPRRELTPLESSFTPQEGVKDSIHYDMEQNIHEDPIISNIEATKEEVGSNSITTGEVVSTEKRRIFPFKIFVVDTNGHFISGIKCMIENQPTYIFINSLLGNHDTIMKNDIILKLLETDQINFMSYEGR